MKIRRLFDQFDFDRDGRIDLTDSLPVNDAVSEQLKAYDTNKDGIITIHEVEKVVAGVRKERGYTEAEFTQARVLMTRHDVNRSTFIEASELFDSPGTGQLPKSMLKKADLDQDGKVGFEELAKYLAKEKS